MTTENLMERLETIVGMLEDLEMEMDMNGDSTYEVDMAVRNLLQVEQD
jgi:hypothetical protein